MRAIRYLAASAAVAAATALAVAAPAATATAASLSVLSLGAPSAAPAHPGDIVQAQLQPSTQLKLSTTPAGTIGLACTYSSWQAQVATNPYVPGSATLQLTTSYSITGCTDNNPKVTGVTSVTWVNLIEITVFGSAPFPFQLISGGPAIQLVVNLATTTGTLTCTYQAIGTPTGTAGPGLGPWSLVNQPFTQLGTPMPQCGAAGTNFFSAAYRPIIDVTAGGAPLYVN